jgi:crotonobetainyl-CoA:carnitine CoA-transferase CaiB-like acyl-CoA transferase
VSERPILPLDGLRVVDLSHALAGPYATYQLQLMGADVIKVEQPGVGDDTRNPDPDFRAKAVAAAKAGNPLPPTPPVPRYTSTNAGKRSITLDLKTPEGLAVLKKLLSTADVVVENYRPDVPAKLGFDWDTVKHLNDQLIYVSVNGFGSKGPLKSRAAFDGIAQAHSGIMWKQGQEGDPPLKAGFALADYFTAYHAFAAIMAAVLQRQKTGRGQRVEVSMLNAMLLFQSNVIADYLVNGESVIPKRSGNRMSRGGSGDVFKAKGGTYIMIGAIWQEWYAIMCRLMEAPEMLTDPKFATAKGRIDNADEIKVEIEKRLAKKTAEEWEELFNEAGCPAATVRTIQEIMAHPQVTGSNLLLDCEVPGGEPIKVVGAGFEFEHDQPTLKGPVALLGEHTDEVLKEAGYSDGEIANLRSKRAI